MLSAGLFALSTGGMMFHHGMPPNIPPQMRAFIEGMQGPLAGVISLVVAALNGFVLFGALKLLRLQNRGIATAASVAAMLPCQCCCVFGLPIRHLGAGGFEQAGSEVAIYLMNDDRPDCTTIKPRPRRELRHGQSTGHARARLADGRALDRGQRTARPGRGGFRLVVVWLFKVMIQYYGQITGDAQPHPVGWIGVTGGILFVASWLWALVTSISLFIEARRNARGGTSGKTDSAGGSAPPKT